MDRKEFNFVFGNECMNRFQYFMDETDDVGAATELTKLSYYMECLEPAQDVLRVSFTLLNRLLDPTSVGPTDCVYSIARALNEIDKTLNSENAVKALAGLESLQDIGGCLGLIAEAINRPEESDDEEDNM